MNSPQYARLSDKEQKELLRQAQAGKSEAAERLVCANMRLVSSVACRFKNMGKEYDDIFQVGCMGLVKAINKFDFDYGVCFSTYAVPLIMGEIRRFMRDDSPISISRTLREQAQSVKKGRERLTADLGREPTLAELSKQLAMPAEQINTALEAMLPVASIYESVFNDDGDSYLLDYLAVSDNENYFDKIVLDELITGLADRERLILQLRYQEDKTQSEIGRLLSISQVQVSRIERAAVLKLRKSLEEV